MKYLIPLLLLSPLSAFADTITIPAGETQVVHEASIVSCALPSCSLEKIDGAYVDGTPTYYHVRNGATVYPDVLTLNEALATIDHLKSLNLCK